MTQPKALHLHAVSNVLRHTDTARKKLFSLPKGAILLRIHTEVNVVFNDSGTDEIRIGDEANSARFVALVATGAAGFAARTLAEGGRLAPVGPVLDVFGQYVGQNANATAGELEVFCEYLAPFQR